MVCGPKYDGKYLHALLRRYLGDTRLDRTLTNVVIPTFDIAYMQPTIFSTFEVTEVLSRLNLFGYLVFFLNFVEGTTNLSLLEEFFYGVTGENILFVGLV